jgi:uncharacterized protein DUF6279
VVTKRAFNLMLIVAAALIATACSLTRLAYSNAAFAYSNATPVLTWMVTDYVDLSEDQKDWVRERLVRAFAWHRAQELPEYRRFFERVLVESQDTISVEEARNAHRELRAYYHRTLERVLPDVADFLAQLNGEQVGQLERRFDKDNRKMVSDSLDGTPGERRERRVKRFLDHIEEFTGSLTDAQRELVAERAGALADLTDDHLADRRYRQAGVLAVARSEAPREKGVAELKRLWIDAESWRSPDYLRKLRKRDEQLFEMIAALSATLSPEQRASFQKRVRGFLRDITELTAST